MELSLYGKDEYSKYYRRKVLETILYNENIEFGKDALEDIFPYQFIYHDSFLDSLDFLIRNQLLVTKHVQDNSFSLLQNYFDFAKKFNLDNKKEWIYKIQLLIVYLNEIKLCSREEFIRVVRVNRTLWKKDFWSFFYRQEDMEYFENCIISDIFLLYLCSENVPNEDFLPELSYHLISYGAFQSILAFSLECPTLFLDEVFRNRVETLFLENRKLIFHQQSMYELDELDKKILKGGAFLIQNELYYKRMRQFLK